MRSLGLLTLSVVAVASCADARVSEIPPATRSLVGCYQLDVEDWRPDPNGMTTQRNDPPPPIDTTLLLRLGSVQPWSEPEYFALEVSGHPPFDRLEQVWLLEDDRLSLLIGAPFGPYSVSVSLEEPMVGAMHFRTDDANQLEWVADAELRSVACG